MQTLHAQILNQNVSTCIHWLYKYACMYMCVSAFTSDTNQSQQAKGKQQDVINKPYHVTL